MARKGKAKTPKIDPAVEQGRQREPVIADDFPDETPTMPDTEAEARQSELRFEEPKRDPLEGVDSDALDSFLTEDEKQAPYAAVLTAEQMAAILDASPADIMRAAAMNAERLAVDPVGTLRDWQDAKPVKPPERAADDGPSHEPPGFGGMIELSALWAARLDMLAKKAGKHPVTLLEDLIKRHWIASGAGRGA